MKSFYRMFFFHIFLRHAVSLYIAFRKICELLVTLEIKKGRENRCRLRRNYICLYCIIFA